MTRRTYPSDLVRMGVSWPEALAAYWVERSPEVASRQAGIAAAVVVNDLKGWGISIQETAHRQRLTVADVEQILAWDSEVGDD